ncbi:centrosomal protein of 85 kDa-like [Mya arenaria]|uniref:centrosomal protein of 85 kDa-like n=1 Tax=Mya arenaria TaxID=6604 RepID=UPI0022E236D9|nr:centrosomal protein of 85 kDa-like [Mya arenaria]
MSWRGSGNHLDSNVPDYQKMLQGRSTSSGWSSTQPSFSSYSSRFPGASSGSFLNSRNNPGYSHTSQQAGYSSTYQPGKYGVPVDPSFNTTATSAANYRTLTTDESSARQNNGYDDKTYGYVGREFDLEPYRSASHRVTDYASDSGYGLSAGQGHARQTDYSSDSGRGHLSRPSTTEYSSDGGMKYRHRRQKSGEFDLEIPSLDSSHSPTRSQNDDLFTSPAKSHVTVSEFERFTKNQGNYDSDGHSEHYNHIKHLSRSEPNLDNHTNHKNHSSRNSRTNQNGDGRVSHHDSDHDLHNSSNEKPQDENDDDFRANFASPPLFQGNMADITMANPKKHQGGRGRASDLTKWQQGQRSSRSPTREEHDNHDRLTLKPPHGKGHHREQKTLRDYDYDPRTQADLLHQQDVEERLRARVEQLEGVVKEYKRGHRGWADDPGVGGSFSQMQELEYRNAELRTELARVKLQKDTEVEDLEIKLGGVENEVVELKEALRKTQPDTANIKHRLCEREDEIVEWKMKHGQLAEKYARLKEKVDGMERYLADLPTLEEFTKNAEDLAVCSEELEVKRGQVEDLEQRLEETSQTLTDKEATIHDLENKQKHLAGKMREVSAEIYRMKTHGEGKALALCQEELAETREVKDKVTQDLEKAKKLLEANHRRVRQVEGRHVTEVRGLQERLSQEEEAVTALREEARLKEEQVSKLKKSLKEFGKKNQDLMEETMMMKEQLQQLQSTSLDDAQRLQRRFVREMSACFTDLQSLVQILVQQAEGKDPNVSLLLGTRASVDEDACLSMSDEQSLKHWFGRLRELRSEVEQVRSTLCDKLAKDMGDNLNCAQQ